MRKGQSLLVRLLFSHLQWRGEKLWRGRMKAPVPVESGRARKGAAAVAMAGLLRGYYAWVMVTVAVPTVAVLMSLSPLRVSVKVSLSAVS